jgi:carbonic anhydrase
MALLALLCIMLSLGCISSCSHRQDPALPLTPYAWNRLNHQYPECDIGTHQSPINLSHAKAIEMDEKIFFNYQNSDSTIINNGHNLEMEFAERNYVTLNQQNYYLKQFHFHSKSEHALNGIFYPGELHLVHIAPDGKILVLGFFIELGTENSPGLNFFQELPEFKQSQKISNVDLSDIISGTGSHFYYEGSLSTPPCSENVHWIVFDKHLKIREQDLEKFEHYFQHSDRPLQKIKQHKLFYTQK